MRLCVVCSLYHAHYFAELCCYELLLTLCVPQQYLYIVYACLGTLLFSLVSTLELS